MAGLVGIIKELREGEKVSFDSKAVVPIVMVKEVETKGLIRRSQREVPTALMYANVYVTNRRILFLVFYQLRADDVRKEGLQVKLTDLTATWFAVPVESIQQIETHGLESGASKDVRQLLEKGGEPEAADRPGVELVYGARDLTDEDKEFSQSLLQMGALQRLTTKAESMSDKLFIGIDQASLVASSVQAAMGIKQKLEGAPELATQQFNILDPQVERPAPERQEEPES